MAFVTNKNYDQLVKHKSIHELISNTADSDFEGLHFSNLLTLYRQVIAWEPTLTMHEKGKAPKSGIEIIIIWKELIKHEKFTPNSEIYKKVESHYQNNVSIFVSKRAANVNQTTVSQTIDATSNSTSQRIKNLSQKQTLNSQKGSSNLRKILDKNSKLKRNSTQPNSEKAGKKVEKPTKDYHFLVSNVSSSSQRRR